MIVRNGKLKRLASIRPWRGRKRFYVNIVTSCILFILTIYILYQLRHLGKDSQINYKYQLRRHVESIDDLLKGESGQQDNSEIEMLNELQNKMPNLPVIFWNKTQTNYGNDRNCGRFPRITELEFSNLYWQTLRTSNGTFQLFGAYLDNRPKNVLGPTVRILGMVNRIGLQVLTFCQLWFEGRSEAVVVPIHENKYLWMREWSNNKQDVYQPYLIACPIPAEFKNEIPQSVSLVENSCDNASNNLRVIYNKAEQKKDFGVCVKGLNFLQDNFAMRLIEWIELMNILGADKIFFYELTVPDNIRKILEYYESIDKVTVTPLTLAGGQPNVPILRHLYLKDDQLNKRVGEMIPYNDCFYKHMYEYKYIVPVDLDEVIMPIDGTWKDLITKVSKKAKGDISSFSVRNVYFIDDFLHEHGWFEDIPKYMHMLQHVYRTQNFTKSGNFEKSFQNTERVLSVHNHYPLQCISGACKNFAIDLKDAQLQHYTEDCVKSLKDSCKELKATSVVDANIWRFEEPLIHNMKQTLKILQRTLNNITVTYSGPCDCDCKCMLENPP